MFIYIWPFYLHGVSVPFLIKGVGNWDLLNSMLFQVRYLQILYESFNKIQTSEKYTKYIWTKLIQGHYLPSTIQKRVFLQVNTTKVIQYHSKSLTSIKIVMYKSMQDNSKIEEMY
jgi:hypothetical protein